MLSGGVKMEKKIKLSMFIVLLGIIIGCSYYGLAVRLMKNKEEVKNETATIVASDTEERFIVFEMKVDLNNDGKKERIVLDALKEGYGLDPGVYDRLLIYQYKDGNEEVVFDSIEAGIIDFCGDYISDKELIKIEDNNKNGVLEIYLQEYGFACDPFRVAIIEEINKKFVVLFFDHLESFSYTDFDNDNVLELIGITNYGQFYFSTPLWTVFVRRDNEYYPSPEYTKRYNEIKLKESLMRFEEEQNWETAYDVITMYILCGLEGRMEEFINSYRNILINLESPWGPILSEEELDEASKSVTINQQLMNETKEWLESLKELK